jgi:hypothetical protein
MPVRKKKATFYLPEDLLRATRVHAARTDKRESQVVEGALRAFLGYDAASDVWAHALPSPAAASTSEQQIVRAEDDAGADKPAAAVSRGRPRARTSPSSQPDAEVAANLVPEPEQEPEAPLEDPLDAEEAIAVAVAELHALRAERHAGRS